MRDRIRDESVGDGAVDRVWRARGVCGREVVFFLTVLWFDLLFILLLAAAVDGSERIFVVGEGATGCELALFTGGGLSMLAGGYATVDDHG